MASFSSVVDSMSVKVSALGGLDGAVPLSRIRCETPLPGRGCCRVDWRELSA
jgi:hypothetical protein